MSSFIYISSDPNSTAHLSNTACALIPMLCFHIDLDNVVNKKEFTKKVGWYKDYRTWDKYWKELVRGDVLVQLDKKTWMVSPHQLYSGGVHQSGLIIRWNEARDAVN